MTAPDVYLATCAQLPTGDPDTARLAKHLRTLGLSVEIAVWDDPDVGWSEASPTVIRSTWDYHTRRTEFLRWAGSVPRLYNAASVVEWNTDKQYLLDLPADVKVVPTRVLSAPTAAALGESLAELGWDEGVIKPAIGLDGYGVSRIRRGEISDEPREGEWLLQAFVAEASREGETSVVMIDGHPTHAVQRLPPPDDFRAQERLGGRVEACDPPDDVLRLATAAMAGIDPVPLYARVDIVRYLGTPRVMELELVEPSLFFEYSPGSLFAMSDAIQRIIDTHPSGWGDT